MWLDERLLKKDFKTLSLPNANLTKSSKLLNPEHKGVTTQMKALDEFILMVLFVLLLKIVHFITNDT